MRPWGNNKTSRKKLVASEGKQEQLREQRAPDEIKICMCLGLGPWDEGKGEPW